MHLEPVPAEHPARLGHRHPVPKAELEQQPFPRRQLDVGRHDPGEQARARIGDGLVEHDPAQGGEQLLALPLGQPLFLFRAVRLVPDPKVSFSPSPRRVAAVFAAGRNLAQQLVGGPFDLAGIAGLLLVHEGHGLVRGKALQAQEAEQGQPDADELIPDNPFVIMHAQVITRTNICIEQHLAPAGQVTPETRGWRHSRNYVELVIVDESERLRPTALELLRDRYDRDNLALILIGMPGLEKQFSHYPQFYSRVGFAHQYRPLNTDEMLFVLQRHWRSLGKTLNPDDFTDAQTIAAISRITRGNFRLLERLFPQIERVLKINELQTITNDVVEAAASTLVIGVN